MHGPVVDSTGASYEAHSFATAEFTHVVKSVLVHVLHA